MNLVDIEVHAQYLLFYARFMKMIYVLVIIFSTVVNAANTILITFSFSNDSVEISASILSLSIIGGLLFIIDLIVNPSKNSIKAIDAYNQYHELIREIKIRSDGGELTRQEWLTINARRQLIINNQPNLIMC